MNKTRILTFILFFLSTMAACSKNPAEPVDNDNLIPQVERTEQIYLYGEKHGIEKILDKELELWCEYYQNEDIRHLFIEVSYFTAEFLNIWMKADNDDILDAVYNDWVGTSSYNPYVLDFYKNIKSKCPETIFHGTDVGHQFYTTGERFLRYLEKNNMKDSEQYLLAKEAIEQGIQYKKYSDAVYRENKMVENFIREFDALEDKRIMGIYGAAHTGLDDMDYITQSVPCMANQLKEQYGEAVYSENLIWLVKEIEPYSEDTINVNGKDYKALYFGKEDLNGLMDYKYREFWRLEDAYDDFKDKPKTDDVLPYEYYPMLIDINQVFVIDYEKIDGTIIRMYYRSDGFIWDGKPTTEEFAIE